MSQQTNHTCSEIINAVYRQKQDSHPLVLALDGGSGSGKSTIARCIGAELEATIIPCDGFFAANIPDSEWLIRSPAEKVREAIVWQRIRDEALVPLLNGEIARWHSFDFEAGLSKDGTYPMQAEYTEREPNAIIILDGIYSTRPELSDYVDLAVLVDVPIKERHQRLKLREEADFLKAWHERWDEAEEYYFTQIRPPESFDLIVQN